MVEVDSFVEPRQALDVVAFVWLEAATRHWLQAW
jgi:hypothetical protein